MFNEKTKKTFYEKEGNKINNLYLATQISVQYIEIL